LALGKELPKERLQACPKSTKQGFLVRSSRIMKGSSPEASCIASFYRAR
jgi:hypothetical protein